MRFVDMPLDVLKEMLAADYVCEVGLDYEKGRAYYKIVGIPAGKVKQSLAIVDKYYRKEKGVWIAKDPHRCPPTSDA